MLRSLWIIISTLAVANLFALLGFIFWLNATDRINPERVERIRTLFAPTVAAEKAGVEQRAAEAEAAAAAALEAAKVGKPPLTAEQKIDDESAKEEIAAQHGRRVQRETADLINTLVREREELERQRTQFQSEVDAFNMMRRTIANEEGSEQFQKTVLVYQSVKPPEAKNMMSTLLAAGQMEQVVSYINALSPRIASKIITEFQNQDPALAAELLERLRLRGTAVASSDPPPAKPLASGGTAPAEGP